MSTDRRGRIGWRRLLGVFTLLLGFGGLGFLLVAWLPLAMLLWLVPSRHRPGMTRGVIHHAMRAYRGWLGLIGGCRFDTSALDGLRHARPGVIIANHPSLLDALVVLAHTPNVVCVMRAGLLRNPLLALPARLAGYLPNDNPVDMMLGGRAAIRGGCHVLLFPEGSRTRHPDKSRVDPFHPAAFMLAERARAPIHAYLFVYDSPLLGKTEPLWHPPLAPVRLRVTRFTDVPTTGSGPRTHARAWQNAYQHALEAT